MYTSGVKAQEQSGNFLKAGVSDGTKLINAYFAPSLKGFGQGINDGWYNTAKPLGLWGFDLRFNLGIGLVDKVDQSYNINNLGLNTDRSKPYLVLAPGVDPKRPSLYGIKEANPPKAYVRSNVGGVDTLISEFTMPNGIGSTYTPSLPMLQLSLGIIKNTQLTIRYFPKTLFPDYYKVRLFGIGVKHDLIQWIPRYNDVLLNSKRPFDCSVFIGYTNFGAELTKSLLQVDPTAYNPDPGFNYSNQSINFTGAAFTSGIIVSKDFSPFKNIGVDPYIGVNYAWSKVHLKFEGDFPITSPNKNNEGGNNVTIIEKVSNPVNLETTMSNVRMNAGLRMKLYMVTISAEYSIGKVNTVTVGLGINFQSLKPYKM